MMHRIDGFRHVVYNISFSKSVVPTHYTKQLIFIFQFLSSNFRLVETLRSLHMIRQNIGDRLEMVIYRRRFFFKRLLIRELYFKNDNNLTSKSAPNDLKQSHVVETSKINSETFSTIFSRDSQNLEIYGYVGFLSY